MGKGFRKDDAGQMYTIEAVLAVSMMIAALYIVMVFTPVDITPRQDFAEVQLYHYGRDVLTLLSYRDAEIAVGLLRYELYREHSPGDWAHDVNVTDIKTVDGKNWTTTYLYIDYDAAGECRRVEFIIFDKANGTWVDPEDVEGSNLWRISYARPGGDLIESYPEEDDITFPHKGRRLEYTISMVWFEDGEGGTSTPILVWVDKKPEDRDTHLDPDERPGLNITYPTLKGERILLQYAEIGQGGYVDVWRNPNLKGRWLISDSETNDIVKIEIGETVGGVTLTSTADPDIFRFTFNAPAKGGHTISFGPRWALGHHTDPVFVCVGRPGLAPGAELSPFEAALRGIINLTELNHLLRSYIPENVEYNLAFSNSTGEIAHMNIINGIPAPGAVTVTMPVFATVGGVSEVYMARLILWYR